MCIMLIFLLYVKLTFFVKPITVKYKYIKKINSIEHYLLYDDNNQVYILNVYINVIMSNRLKFEDIKESTNYLIKGYGLNLPLIYLYKNIINIKQV